MNTAPGRLAAALADRYRIERELGAGGMATVYLAQDLKHDRKVAIKVLRPELAAVIGAERFLSEIKTTANLQHPHILPLHDSGQADSFLFYVMPFVQGESLRDRVHREKQLPIGDAVRIATEVAGALDYAHRQGIIHRDIKPENILLHDGRALVADFGIALAATSAGSRMTETGMSLGTPHYMSPEQAMGDRELTPRSDVYALGAMTYEMLLGEPPFTGPTAQSIVAKVMTETPAPIAPRRRSVPEAVEAAVLTALEKLPADRFASASEFAAALTALGPFTSGTARRAAVPARAQTARISVLVAVVALLAATTGWLSRGWSSRPIVPEPIRFTTTLGQPGIDRPYIAISADGRKIVQTVFDSTGTPRLVVRDLGSNTVAPIAGTEGAWDGAEFSPDGESLAFVVDWTLKKVAVRGGPAITLLDSLRVEASGMAWSPSGDLFFTGRDTGMWKLPASGGSPVQLTRIDTARKEFAHWAPQLLPGGRTLIYTNYATPVARSRIEAYDLESGHTTVLAEGAVFGRYSPSGHLLYARDATLFAVPFDPDRVETRGAAVPVQSDVAWAATDGRAGYAVSANGTFAYLRESEWRSDGTLAWRDRAGRDISVIGSPGAFSEPRLSPDGRWIALTIIRPKRDLWLYDLRRRVLTQLTRAPAYAFNAVWMPDSRRIVHTFEDRVYELHIVPIDASEPDRALLTSPFDKYASSISPDGRQMLVTESSRGDQLTIASVDGSSPSTPALETGREQRAGVFSPDGRWIAFSEHGEGRADIYLRSVGGVGGRRLVSTGGGTEPRWTKGGREIVYLSRTEMMSVSVDPLTGAVGNPTSLFRITDIGRDPDGRTHSYDVTPDGTRFLVVKRVERSNTLPLVVVLNWRPDFGRSAGGAR
jgi:serine/threonine-protein kinase